LITNTTVNHDGLAGHITVEIRDQKFDNIGAVLNSAHPAQRDMLNLINSISQSIRLYDAWGNAVDVDITNARLLG